MILLFISIGLIGIVVIVSLAFGLALLVEKVGRYL